MPLGQLGAVGAMDQWDMTVNWCRPAHCLDDLELAGCVVEVICTAKDMRNPHVEIIDHHGEHVSRRAVTPQKHHVVELGIGPANFSLDHVPNDGLALCRSFQSNHERLVCLIGSCCSVASSAIVTNGLAGGPLLSAHLFKLLRGGVAAI